jgi:predicted PurR-regulated permease PerM
VNPPPAPAERRAAEPCPGTNSWPAPGRGIDVDAEGDRADPGAAAHDHRIAQPHQQRAEGPVADAEARAADSISAHEPLGRPGPPLDRRSPFLIGLSAAAGVAVLAAVVVLILVARTELILVGIALFLAVGLEPAVSWLIRRRLPRWAAVTIVVVVVFAAIGGFLAAAVPVLVQQATQFATQAPVYLASPQGHASLLGRLDDRFHLQQTVTQAVSGEGVPTATGGLLSVGEAVFTGATDTLIVAVLVVYLLVDMPRVRRLLYRLVPASRRPRAVLLGDAIFARFGAYVLGNLLVSLIAGLATLAFLLIAGVPYPLLLAVFVALLDLVPVVGSIVGGVVVSLVSLSVSVPVALAAVVFFVLYRFLEDYLLVPKIIGRVVQVPALLTLVAVLLGAAIYGVIGALVAIPIAAAILLLLREIVFPRLDRA